MRISNQKEVVILFIGDILLLSASLYVTLLVRYLELPGANALLDHARPFSILLVLWIAVFYIFGLYGKQTLLAKRRLSKTIIEAQVVNAVLSVLFFYAVPGFGIATKNNLFIHLVISVASVSLWRLFG